MFEEIKAVIVSWVEDNEEFEEITPETNILDIGGVYQIWDVIDCIQETYDVEFTVADIVKFVEEKVRT
jgi:hypothetical protein